MMVPQRSSLSRSEIRKSKAETDFKQLRRERILIKRNDPSHEFRPKALWKWEIAAMYGVSVECFRNWLKPHLEALYEIGYTKRTKMLTPRMVEKVFELLGNP